MASSSEGMSRASAHQSSRVFAIQCRGAFGRTPVGTGGVTVEASRQLHREARAKKLPAFGPRDGKLSGAGGRNPADRRLHNAFIMLGEDHGTPRHRIWRRLWPLAAELNSGRWPSKRGQCGGGSCDGGRRPGRARRNGGLLNKRFTRIDQSALTRAEGIEMLQHVRWGSGPVSSVGFETGRAGAPAWSFRELACEAGGNDAGPQSRVACEELTRPIARRAERKDLDLFHDRGRLTRARPRRRIGSERTAVVMPGAFASLVEGHELNRTSPASSKGPAVASV